MKKIYTTLICLFFLNCALFATKTPGFIITKDAKIIMGQVADIFYSNWKTELVFINEMGRRYYYHPAVIHGFAIQKDGEILRFESKFHKGTWRFLEVLEKGKNLTLYRSPIIKTQQTAANYYSEERIFSKNVKEYWIGVGDQIPLRIYPLSYKKRLRNCLKGQSEIVEKIGKKGYKFKDIKKIFREYNELIEQQTKQI